MGIRLTPTHAGGDIIYRDLTGFGAEAVKGAELEDLLTQACQKVAAGLGVTHVKVLEYLPDERMLVVKAGVGWSEGVVGRERLGIDLASPAGFALQTGQPVVSNNLAEEERFRIPAVLADHDVKSATNVIIKYESFVYGVLEADSLEQKRFTEEDSQYLQGFANILALAIHQAELARKNWELTQNLEAMLHELTHRTKNNNQILFSLVHLQIREAESLLVKEQLEHVKNRILVLNELDNLILSTKNSDQLDLGRYLISIANKVLSLDAENAKHLKLESSVVPKSVSSAIAQPIAMIVNEFLANSFKYAFSQGADTISISLQVGDGQTSIEIADNGPGFSDSNKSGLGFQVIEAMARQLRAQLDWDTENGTRLKITLPD